MKHYIEPLQDLLGSDRKVQAFSPFDGEVREVHDSPPGTQIYIEADAGRGWNFIFFHINTEPHIKEGVSVKAGELVGYADKFAEHNFDFALKHFGIMRQDFDSPFMHMQQELLDEYAAHGVSVENIITSKAERDSNPCPVSGTSNGDAAFTGYGDKDFVEVRNAEVKEAPKAKEPDGEELQQTNELQEIRPVLKNLGINMQPWDKKTNRAGDFLFENKNYVDNKIFTEFANKIVNEFGEKLLPEIGFNVPVGTKVVSPIDGVIIDVKFYEPSQDYLVSMKTDESSPWIVGFEHIYNLRMKAGDKVLAGQELAEVSPSYGRTEFGNVEINVWIGGQNIIKYCPFEFLDESLKQVYEEKIHQLARDWEEFIGKNVYSQEDWVAPGCLLHDIIER